MLILICNLLKSFAERITYVFIKMVSKCVNSLRLPCLHGQWSLRLISSNLYDIHFRLCQRAAVRDPMPVQQSRHLPLRFLKRSIISRCLILILYPQFNSNIRKQLTVFIPASGWVHRQWQTAWLSEHLMWKAEFPLQCKRFIPLPPININGDPFTKSSAVH